MLGMADVLIFLKVFLLLLHKSTLEQCCHIKTLVTSVSGVPEHLKQKDLTKVASEKQKQDIVIKKWSIFD